VAKKMLLAFFPPLTNLRLGGWEIKNRPTRTLCILQNANSQKQKINNNKQIKTGKRLATFFAVRASPVRVQAH